MYALPEISAPGVQSCPEAVALPNHAIELKE
jgi:hypothetical protein